MNSMYHGARGKLTINGYKETFWGETDVLYLDLEGCIEGKKSSYMFNICTITVYITPWLKNSIEHKHPQISTILNLRRATVAVFSNFWKKYRLSRV